MKSTAVKQKACKICRARFRPFNSLALVCSPKCAIEFARKQAAANQIKLDRIEAKKSKEQRAKERKQKADFRRTDTKWLKANAEFYCNKYIRLRDAGKGCISCGTHNPNIVYAAGHFIPKGRCIPLRYDERNIHLQCNNYCNKHLSGNPTPYEAALRIKLGDEAVEWLKGPHEPVRYMPEDYLRIIDEYKAKIKLLQTGERND